MRRRIGRRRRPPGRGRVVPMTLLGEVAVQVIGPLSRDGRGDRACLGAFAPQIIEGGRGDLAAWIRTARNIADRIAAHGRGQVQAAGLTRDGGLPQTLMDASGNAVAVWLQGG